MKNIVNISLFVFIFLNHTKAQESYKGRMAENTFIEIKLYKNENGTVLFSRAEIDGNSSVFTGLYNLPDLEFDKESKTLLIPSDGHKYWLIPFNMELNPIPLREEATYCIDCICDHHNGFLKLTKYIKNNV